MFCAGFAPAAQVLDAAKKDGAVWLRTLQVSQGQRRPGKEAHSLLPLPGMRMRWACCCRMQVMFTWGQGVATTRTRRLPRCRGCSCGTATSCASASRLQGPTESRRWGTHSSARQDSVLFPLPLTACTARHCCPAQCGGRAACVLHGSDGCCRPWHFLASNAPVSQGRFRLIIRLITCIAPSLCRGASA